MTELLEEPDFETIAISYLKSRTTMTELVPAEWISGKLRTGWRAGQSALRIRRVGGLPTEGEVGVLARGRLQVEAFAGDEDTAGAIARRADVELRRMPTELEDETVTISAVRKDLPISNVPDPDSDSARYLFGTVLYGRLRAA